MIHTAFGTAELVEEVTVPQATEDREFVARVQLLEGQGEPFVRFVYSTSDRARRGPVTLRIGDLRRLARALGKAPKLRAALTVLLKPVRERPKPA